MRGAARITTWSQTCWRTEEVIAMRVSKHLKGIRGVILLMAGLSGAICAHSSTVYVRNPLGVTFSDPSDVGLSFPGWYQAQANLNLGTFGALSSTSAIPAGQGPFVFTYAGISSLLLTNTSVSSFFDIAFGNLSVHFDGTFGFAPGVAGPSEGTVQGVVSLSVAKNCLQSAPGCLSSVAGVSFGATASYSDPTSAPIFATSGPFLTEDGASVAVTQADTAGLQADLRMGAQRLGPGDFLSVNLDVLAITSATGGATATADFANTATISLLLPQGATLSSDASVPLAWISTASPVPAPPVAWMMASGLLALMGVARRRTWRQTA